MAHPYRTPAPSQWTKADVVRQLASVHGYRRYLEICTATTGFLFAAVREAGFESCFRLIYRCPDDFDDGEPVDFRSPGDDISACLAEIKARGLGFDVIFVDPHHTYDATTRDLRAAFGLIRPGGALVIHDCDPPNRMMARPDHTPGAWCGVTYKAFIDFVLGNDRLVYCTVDTDFGCGVILKQPRRHGLAVALAAEREKQLVTAWRAVGNDYDRAYDLFAVEKQRLLRLVTVEAFRDPERGGPFARRA